MNKREKTGLIIILVVVLTIIAFVICFIYDTKLSNIRDQKALDEFNANIKNITKVEVYNTENKKEVIKVIEEAEALNEIISAIENGKYYKIDKKIPLPVTAASTNSSFQAYFKFFIYKKMIASGSYYYGSKELIFSGFKFKIESLVFDEIIKPYIIEKKNNLILAFEVFLDKHEEYKDVIEFYEIGDDYALRIKFKRNFSQEEKVDMVQKVSEEIHEIKGISSISDDDGQNKN